MDREKGLDLILHTPGGSTAAACSLVLYLREMFDRNIRTIQTYCFNIPRVSL